MTFNPITRDLYTDEGTRIKKLNCPLGADWADMRPLDSGHRLCGHCQHPVLDTALLSEADVLTQVRAQPDTCLKVDLNQANIRLHAHETLFLRKH